MFVEGGEALRMISIAGARTPYGSRTSGLLRTQIPTMEKHITQSTFYYIVQVPALSKHLVMHFTSVDSCMFGDIHAW